VVVDEGLEPGMQALKDALVQVFINIMGDTAEPILNSFRLGIEGATTAINALQQGVNRAKEAILALFNQISSWGGVRSALDGLIGKFDALIGKIRALRRAERGTPTHPASSGTTTINNYTLNVTTQRPTRSVIQDFQLMRNLAVY